MKLTINERTAFNSPTYGRLTMDSVMWKILSFISQDTYAEYEIAVGTDSMTHGRHNTKFALVISVHKVGKGGIYFFKTFHTRRVDELHQKLTMETQLSVDTADFLIKSLGKRLAHKDSRIHLVIHMDIGENGPTSRLINELGGWVSAMGFEYAIKPDSYASSTLADRASK